MKEEHLYRFGAFELRVSESVLERDGQSVSLTPKMFEMLLVLVRNRGKVVDKQQLFEEVWPDSFVEEGNIAFNIRQLRKSLDDDAKTPIYIETIPRRGYRFIADVDEVLPESIKPKSEPIALTEMPSGTSSSKKRFSPIIFVGVLLLGAIVIGAWVWMRDGRSSLPILSNAFASEKLSTTGTVFTAAISPDGKTVVYTTRGAGKESVWLRELDTGSNVPLLPATDEEYFEFVFAPDGKSIYFGRGKPGMQNETGIYRVSMIGGVPEKIVENTQGWVSLSSNGEKISFVRCPYTEEEYCSLWIADSRGGKNERKLASRPSPIRIGDNEISPDGTKIAFANGQSRNQANEFHLSEVDLASGQERDITQEKFFNIKGLAWLPDQTGMLVTASRIPNKYFRIWRVSEVSGDAEPLTKDAETYSVLSLDKAADRLVATQLKQDFKLYSFALDTPAERKLLADATSSTYSSDGRIFFTSTMSGNDEIWTINADGTGQRQLTNDPSDDRRPIVSPDGKFVYFASNRTGEAHVWRMNSDGTNQTQITKKQGGFPLAVTPDGKTLYYANLIGGNLWKVALETSEETSVIDKKGRFAVSADGTMVAYDESSGGESVLNIVSLTDGRTIKSFAVPKERPRLVSFSWMPDGRSLIYLMTDLGYDKNVLYRQELDGGAARQIGSLGDVEVNEISVIAITPDGKNCSVVTGDWRHDAYLIKGLK